MFLSEWRNVRENIGSGIKETWIQRPRSERESGWYLTLHVHRRKFGTERRIDGRRVYLRIVHLCGDSALMEAGEGRRRSFIAIDERPHEIYPETG